MRIKRPLIILLSIFLFGCNDPMVIQENTPIIIDMQPFNDMTPKQVTFIYNELIKIYPHIEVKKTIALPGTAFYSKRNRYRADSLIRYLKASTPKGHVTIGLTNKDISHTNGKIQDYGIMGLAYRPGKSCVVSTYRLSRENLLIQFLKLSLHELGHTQNLPHCPETTCFMRAAEGKNHFDEQTDFCPKCKRHLIHKGWSFKFNI